MSYLNVVLIASAASIPLLLASSNAYSQGNWSSLLDIDREKEAQVHAKIKLQKHSIVSEDKIRDVESYVTNNCPELNSDIIQYGLTSFFKEKREKWERRSTLSLTKAQNEEKSSRTIRALYKHGPQTSQEWNQLLSQVVEGYDVLSFQQQAKKGLEVIIAKAREHLKPENSLTAEAEEMHAAMIVSARSFLKTMKIENKIKRFQQLYPFFIQKQKELMGISAEHFQNPAAVTPLLVIIDGTFRKPSLLPESARSCYDLQPPAVSWKKEDPLHEAREWEHGDLMIGLSQTFSPLTTHHGCYYSTSNDHFDPLGEVSAVHYAALNQPVVFNCSFLPLGGHYYLHPTTGSINFDTPSSERLKLPETFQSWKSRVTQSHSEKEWTGILDDERLNLLKEMEDTDPRSAAAPLHLKKLVTGPDESKTHLVVASPTNDSGPLVKKGFHTGWIKLLNEDITQEHALVALNYNFITEALETDSHSAGEYKDMAVVIPSAYVAVNEKAEESLPYFCHGGHSSATAILSSLTSVIRGLYPTLTHVQVKQAILQGANRTFKDYDEKLHGQGMFNLKGALEIAEAISKPLIH